MASTLTLDFPAVAGRTVTAVCDVGRRNLRREGAAIEAGVCTAELTLPLAAGLSDTRQAGKVEH